jgi:2-dehydropantoate 2-reductase
MRFIVYGAGAIGGVVGAQLHRAGNDVTVVARGSHYTTIRDRGLVFESPLERVCLEIPIMDRIAGFDFTEAIVLLAVKSQDSARALADLRRYAAPDAPVVSLQNGVENEEMALRFFSNVYGVPVMCPTVFLEPGTVQANSAPVTGILDIGRYPQGTDATAAAIAGALNEATFVSEARTDIMAWKYRKLVMNLGNAIQAVCGRAAVRGPIREIAIAEADQVLAVAGIEVVPAAVEKERRGDVVTVAPVAGEARPGGSTWQSLSRQTGSIETDYLNGHIVLLGRLHGVPTPVNALLQTLAAAMAIDKSVPGAVTEEQFLALLP